MQRLNLIPCKAPFWADSGHSQTLWAHFLKSPELENLGQNFEVDLPDGDRLFCYYLPGYTDIVVSLFHGLSGDATTDYMQRAAMLCQKLGHTVVLVNHRGAGQGAPLAVHPYHSGCTEDISRVIEKLRSMYPGKKQISVGYSMSGNILLCLLGGFRGQYKPDAAITLNAPLNLVNGSQNLKTGLNRFYDMRFVLRLRKSIAEKYRQGLIDQKLEISPWATLWDFDEIYTANQAGFKNREEYYQCCSSIHYLSKIDIPTHVLTAADDPFISVSDYLEASFSAQTQVHIENRGGHLGYLNREATLLGTHRWLEYYLYEALRSLEQTLS